MDVSWNFLHARIHPIRTLQPNLGVISLKPATMNITQLVPAGSYASTSDEIKVRVQGRSCNKGGSKALTATNMAPNRSAVVPCRLDGRRGQGGNVTDQLNSAIRLTRVNEGIVACRRSDIRGRPMPACFAIRCLSHHMTPCRRQRRRLCRRYLFIS